MQIDGVKAAGMQNGITGMGQESDAYSRQLQKQISEEQKKLQDISADDTLSPEEKMKKRQEIQQEINNLNIQLRQHQIEMRREKQKETDSGSEVTELTGGSRNAQNAKNKGQAGGISAAGMSAVISADIGMKQARVQGSVANRMENRAEVLKSEMKMDSASGGDTSAKEKELAETEKRAETASASQMNTLKEAGEELKKADASKEGTEKKKLEDGKISGSGKEEEKETEEKKAAGDGKAEDKKEDGANRYAPIDIYL